MIIPSEPSFRIFLAKYIAFKRKYAKCKIHEKPLMHFSNIQNSFALNNLYNRDSTVIGNNLANSKLKPILIFKTQSIYLLRYLQIATENVVILIDFPYSKNKIRCTRIAIASN